jgi:hypothetical protein
LQRCGTQVHTFFSFLTSRKDLISKDNGLLVLHVLLNNLTDPNQKVVDHQSFDWTLFILTGLLPDVSQFFHSLSTEGIKILCASDSLELPSRSQVQLLRVWEGLLAETPSLAKDVTIETSDFLLEYFSRCFTLDSQHQADEVRALTLLNLFS